MITADKVKEAIDNVDNVKYHLEMLMYTEALKGKETIDMHVSITQKDRDLVKKIIKYDKLSKIVNNMIILDKDIWSRARDIDEMLETRMLEFQKGSIRTLEETEYDIDIFTIRGFIVNKLDDDRLEISLPMNTTFGKIEPKHR